MFYSITLNQELFSTDKKKKKPTLKRIYILFPNLKMFKLERQHH